MDNDKNQIGTFVKWMADEGYAIFTIESARIREMILRELKTAPLHGNEQKHGWEFYQGQLNGFDNVMRIFDLYREKHEDLLKESKNDE